MSQLVNTSICQRHDYFANRHITVHSRRGPRALREIELDAFDAGKVLPKYLGQRYHELYASCRREECDRFHAEIPEQDYEWYLRAI
jgi:glutamine synthetase